MPQFTVNPTRFDPYKTFRFRVKWDGKYVAGVNKVSGLKFNMEVIETKDGGDPIPRKSLGRKKCEPITLTRGLTHDKEFMNFANKAAKYSLPDFRKNSITIETYNEAGQVVMVQNLYRCWVSEYQALPELDANGTAAVAMESIKIEFEDFEQDESVPEPKEISV